MFYIKDILKEEYECEVVTPMFLGGADKNSAELRVPSIKGALRFWWRAVYGGEFTGNDAIKKMADSEADIFGSTDKKASFSLSTVEEKIRIQSAPDQKEITRFNVHGHDVSILDYLCYGVCNYIKGQGNVYEKNHIVPGSMFKVIFTFYNALYKEQIIKSFRYLINYGGLGAKSRNGLGSINVEGMSIDMEKYSNGLLSFTSFNKDSKVFQSNNEFNSWQKALSDIGELYRNARTSLEHHVYNKRKLISAPLQVNKRNYADIERHAKPYFLHVNKLPNGKYKGQILYMPYKYSPNNKFNQNLYDQYLTVCDEMNKKIEQLLQGGTN